MSQPRSCLRRPRRGSTIGIMRTSVSEFPKHPLPQIPERAQPQRPPVPPPAVFVYEKQAWQYKVIGRSANDAPLTDEELNALGRDGWELVGVAPADKSVQFFFKRLRD
jgi:hypothetical protein